MKNLIRNQEGALGMILVIGFMALAVPLITASLFLSGALSRDSQVKTDILKRQYAALGVGEYVDYLVSDPVLFTTWKSTHGTATPGTYTETVTIDAIDTTFTLVSLSDPPGAPPPLETTQLSPVLTVSPSEVSAGDTVTFTLTINNQGTELEDLSIVSAGLPPGFSYVEGSTTGVATLDPTESTLGDLSGDIPDYPLLTWDLTSLGVGPQPGSSVVLNFQAVVTNTDGNYCALAWLGDSGGEPSTGSTAQITVGPANSTSCLENRLSIITTVDKQVVPTDNGTLYEYTYTNTVKNLGTEAQSLTGLRNVIPLGFDYKLNSTLIDGVSDSNPQTTLLTDGKWQLDWPFSTGFSVQPGASRTLVFTAEAQVDTGNYSTEAYALFFEFALTDADGDLQVKENATVVGELVSAGSGIQVKEDTIIQGDVRGRGFIQIKERALVQGNIVTADGVQVKEDARVEGNITAGGSVEVKAGAVVTGTIFQNQSSVPAILPSDLGDKPVLAVGTTGVTVDVGQSGSPSPGAYGSLQVKEDATINFSTGQYSFSDIQIKERSIVNFDLSSGPVYIDVFGDVQFKEDVQMVITSGTGTAADIKFRIERNLQFKELGQFKGKYMVFDGGNGTAFTWPSAIVRVVDVFQVTSTNANGEIGSFEAWVGLDSGLINRPIVDR